MNISSFVPGKEFDKLLILRSIVIRNYTAHIDGMVAICNRNIFNRKIYSVYKGLRRCYRKGFIVALCNPWKG